MFPYLLHHIKAQHTWALTYMTECLISSLECPDEVSGRLRLMYTQRGPSNSIGLTRTHTKKPLTHQTQGRTGMKMEENYVDLISPSTLERVFSPGGDHVEEEAFVKWPVISCGHLYCEWTPYCQWEICPESIWWKGC